MNLKEELKTNWARLLILNENIDHEGIDNLMVDFHATVVLGGHLTSEESRTITKEESFPELEKVKLIMQEVISDYMNDPISVEGKPFLCMGIEWLKAYGIEFNKKPLKQ